MKISIITIALTLIFIAGCGFDEKKYTGGDEKNLSENNVTGKENSGKGNLPQNESEVAEINDENNSFKENEVVLEPEKIVDKTADILADTNNFKITTTAESGAGSLREAITNCNTAGGNCMILFEIPQNDAGFDSERGVFTIGYLDTPPSISVDNVVIDGATQTNFTGNANSYGPEVEISGLGNTIEYAFSLINASHVSISNLIIREFLYGIQIYGKNSGYNSVFGCYIGTDHKALESAGNYNGIEIISGAHHNEIGGSTLDKRNIFSGNLYAGIRISDANDNIVKGNFVGVDVTGMKILRNFDGITIEGRSARNKIGGSKQGEGNVTSGNVAYGIDIFGAGSIENVIMGNLIGTDAAGKSAIPNTYGLLFDDRSSKNIVGGINPGEGNLISGNTAFGAYFYNNGTNSNHVVGNKIGTDINGLYAIPNETGVHIDGGTYSNVVMSNLISGNIVAGITIFSIKSDNNLITKNKIGISAQNKPLGNGADGIRIAFGPKNNTIGGSEQDANIIAYNGKNGVSIESDVAENNLVSMNKIYGNYFMGIDIFPEGLNHNDAGDVDGGPNKRMNYPQINSVSCNGSTCKILGILDTVSPENCTVEIYKSSTSEKGFSEGEEFLGQTAPLLNGNFEITVEDNSPFTALAHDKTGNTSEFSPETK